jgi:hypothetical protein
VLVVALTAATAVSAPCTVLTTSANAAPTPSGHPGYWAQTTCSEGDEIAFPEGWRGEPVGDYPSMYAAIDTCLQIGGAIEMRDEASRDQSLESGAGAVYEAPPVSYIAGGVLHLRLKAPHGEVYIATPQDHLDLEDEVFKCGAACASMQERTVSIDHTGGWELFAGALCLPETGESLCPNETDAELDITSATILLKNESTPTASGFAGSLVSGAPVSGNATLTFNAQDSEGPGVYRVGVQVDGQVVWSGTPNLNQGECVANGTYYEALNFRWRQPCPQETGVGIEVPTSGIADGQHQLTVEVEDAAGHTSVVYAHTITIQNHSAPAGLSLISPAPARGPANGTPASEDARLTAGWSGRLRRGESVSAGALTSRYGRAHEIAGKLRSAAGVPIAGALIQASQTPASLGASASSLASTHTGSNGSFTLRVPANSSSAQIELAYRSHLGDAQPAATRTLTLHVPASLSLQISPHVVSVEHTIVLRGRLAGSLPPTGKQVTFEARSPGGPWIEFHNAIVGPDGRFLTTHRFTYPGPVSYQFRVVCKREADFPFLSGASNVVHVQER